MRLEQVGFAALALTDNQPGDQDAAVGVLSFIGSYGTFNISIETGISKPVLGSPSTAQMEIHYFVITNTGGALDITFGDTDFVAPSAAANPLTLKSEVGGTQASGSVTIQAFADPSNGQFGTAVTPGPHGPFTTSPFSDTKTVNFSRGAGPYSLTSKTSLTMPTGGSAGADHVLTVTGAAVAPAALGDFVWHDLNANGIQDAGEPGIPGATVNLKNAAGTIIGTTTTNGAGLYAFTGLIPGTYSVQFVQPTGFSALSPLNAGSDDTKDSDADPAMMLMTATVTLASGDNNTTLDAGFYNPAALGDFVWHDLNANGVQDAGEPGIPNVTVNLKNAGGTVIATTTTNASGLYAFTGLTPGTYSVQFVQPAGFDMVSPLDAGGDDTKDSDADPAMSLMTATVTLASGQVNNTLDAGFFKKAKLGDYVWFDLDGDGIQDANEPPVDGVKVTLTGAGVDGVFGNGDDIMAMQFTDANGMYMFGNLNPGKYKVTFQAPPGLEFTLPNQGANDAVDSDADVATGMTQVVTLPSGGMDLTLDAGLVEELTGGGEGCTPGFWKQSQHFQFWTLYTQTDKYNAVFGVTSSFGANFTLLNALNKGGGGESALARHAVAALLNSVSPNVDYLFTVSQVINLVRQAYATGSFETIKNQLAAQNEMGCDMDDHDTPPAPGGNSSLSGFVYKDLDDDGVKDASEAGIGGVKVTLTGTDNLGNNVNLTAFTTVSTGAYSFTGLRPGTYKLTETQPLDCLDGKDTLGSLGGVLSNDMFSSIALGSGVNGVNYDFGELPGPTSGGGEGCTPGFWKQSQHFQFWTAYSTSQSFDAVFGVNATGNATLLEALEMGGGGEQALMRHATAALLNAASGTVDYLYSVEQVIALVQQAYATGDFEGVKNLFAAQNELGCPDM